MDSDSVGADICHYEGQSYGGESRTTTGSSSMKTIDGFEDGSDPVEVPRGVCRVIFVYGRGKKRVQVVCCNKYGKCERKGHLERQKEEKDRGNVGWYVGVYSKANKLVGGLMGTHMDAAQARELREGHRNASRKAATQRGGSALKRSEENHAAGRSSNTTTPSSGGGTGWVDPVTGQPMGPSYQMVGSAILKAAEEANHESGGPEKSIREVTERIAELQQGRAKRNRAKFREGDCVGYVKGGRMIVGIVTEVFLGSTPEEEPFYAILREEGGEVQISEGSLELVSDEQENRVRPPREIMVKSSSSGHSERCQGKPSATPAPGEDVMGSLKTILQSWEANEKRMKSEMDSLRAEVERLQARDALEVETPKAPPKPTKDQKYSQGNFIAVAKGRSEASVGVFDFHRAMVELKGVPDALWKRVNTEEEGWMFIHAEQEDLLRRLMSEGAPPASPETIDVPPGSTSLQAALGALKNNPSKTLSDEPEYHQPGQKLGLGLSDLGGRATGPDPSLKVEGKIFNMLITDATKLRYGLVPCPKHMSPASQAQLLGQALDVTLLPMSDNLGGSDGGETNVALARALASMAGTRTELELGGEPVDHNWKGGNKVTVGRIKNMSVLKERLAELRANKRAIEQVLVGRLASVLYHAGYDETVAEDWATTSILYRMGCDSQYYYIQLHEHILSKCFDEETECNFENAKLEIDLHSAELIRLRNLWPSRIQMICAIYAYLRDQSEKSFRSEKLQEKRQAIQYAAMKKQAAKMEEMLKKLNNPQKNPGTPGGNEGQRDRCWHCQQRGIHGNGKAGCLWKDLPSEEAKIKGAEYKAQKAQRAGGES